MIVINTNVAAPYYYLQVMQYIICLNIEGTELVLGITVRQSPAG